MKTEGRFALLGIFIALTLCVSPAVAGTGQMNAGVSTSLDQPVTGAGVPVVLKDLAQCGGFVIEAGDGTVTDCVPVSTVDLPAIRFAVANDGSIVYDEVSQGATDVNDDFQIAAGPVWLVGPDRAPLELDSSPYDFDASLSYDGSKVTFARADSATRSSDIYVVNADGSGLKRVASGGGNNFLSSPKFSPDRGSIAYLCAAAGAPSGTGLGCAPTPAGTYGKNGVMLMSADGSDQRMIVRGAADAGDPIRDGAGDNGVDSVGTLSWSPNGKWLTVPGCVRLVAGSDECESDQAFAYRTDGSDVLKILDPSSQVTHESPDPGGNLLPQFCGSSTQILFQLSWDANGNSGPFSYLVNRDGTNNHQVFLWPGGQQSYAECVPPATGGGPAATVDVAQSSPFPRGEVAVKSTIPQCSGFLVETATAAFTTCIQGNPGFEFDQSHWPYDVAADDSVVFTESSTSGIWLSRPGKAPVELDSSPEDNSPAISPDGSRVAFVRFDPSTASPSSNLYVANADGSGLKLVASGDGTHNLAWPTFSPDGSTIAYIDDRYGVMLMNLDGSNKRMILSGSAVGPLSWSPDAKLLAMSTGGQVYAYHTDGSDLFDNLDPDRQITHEEVQWSATSPQFSPDGSQILYSVPVDESGTYGLFWFVVNRDGTNRHEVFLSPNPWACGAGTCRGDFEWGVFVPPSTGGTVPKPVKPTKATVPDVHALSLRSAKRRLERVRLRGTVTQRRFSSRIRRGRVLSQYPRARARASLKKKRSRVVKLVLSRGKRPASKKR